MQQAVSSCFFKYILIERCCTRTSNPHVLNAGIQHSPEQPVFHIWRCNRRRQEGRGFSLSSHKHNETSLLFNTRKATASDTANQKLQILHKHLQYVQTSNLSRKGEHYTSLFCALQPKCKIRGCFRSKKYTCTESQIHLGP